MSLLASKAIWTLKAVPSVISKDWLLMSGAKLVIGCEPAPIVCLEILGMYSGVVFSFSPY